MPDGAAEELQIDGRRSERHRAARRNSRRCRAAGGGEGVGGMRRARRCRRAGRTRTWRRLYFVAGRGAVMTANDDGSGAVNSSANDAAEAGFAGPSRAAKSPTVAVDWRRWTTVRCSDRSTRAARSNSGRVAAVAGAGAWRAARNATASWRRPSTARSTPACASASRSSRVEARSAVVAAEPDAADGAEAARLPQILEGEQRRGVEGEVARVELVHERPSLRGCTDATSGPNGKKGAAGDPPAAAPASCAPGRRAPRPPRHGYAACA